MQFRRRIACVLGGLAVAAALTACGGNDSGLTCGPGTQAQSGKCTLTEDGCSAGTVLAEDGTCVPEGSVCAAGTTFDAELGQCVVNTDITCGDGTVAQDGACVPEVTCGDGTVAQDGFCVPEVTCGSGTVAQDGHCVPEVTCGPGTEAQDGKCVVSEPTTCGTHTQRDANSGECVVTDQVCADGTAYDSASDTCVATDAVCARGTSWDDTTGMCMPDAQCQPDDVLVGGYCMSPAEQLAQNADYTEAQPHTAQPTQITLKPVGQQFVFAGSIATPDDYDGGFIFSIDQDVDLYTFDANAGDLLQINVQPSVGWTAAFKVENADGSWVRYSPFTTGAARQIMVPATGSYVLTVLPLVAVTDKDTIAPVGGPDWTYVGTIEQLAAPTPQSVALLSTSPGNSINGNLTGLADNYYDVTDLPAGSLVQMSPIAIDDHMDVKLVVWGDAADADHIYTLPDRGPFLVQIPNASQLHMLVDWSQMRGSEDHYGLSRPTVLNSTDLGKLGADQSATSTATLVKKGDALYATVQIAPGQVIEVSQDNASSASAALELDQLDHGKVAGDDAVAAISDTAGADHALYYYAVDGGTFAVRVSSPNGTELTDETVTVRSFSPDDMGGLAIPGTAQHTGQPLSAGYADYGLFSVPQPAYLWVNVPSNARVVLYDMDGNEVASGTTDFHTVLPYGDYMFAIVANADLSSDAFTIDVDQEPVAETEPNDTTATATSAMLGSLYEGAVDASDTDVYTFNMFSDMMPGQALVVDARDTTAGPASYDCKLVDSTGAEVASRTGASEGCVLVVDGLTSGDYYVEISAPSAVASQTYTVKTSMGPGVVEAEPNDTAATAQSASYTDLTGAAWMYGEATDTSDVDFYEFTTSSDLTDTLTIKSAMLSHHPGQPTLALLDNSGAVIAQGTIGAGDLQVQPADMPAGTYRVEVTWPSPAPGEEAQYKFKFELPASGGGHPGPGPGPGPGPVMP